MKTKYEVLEAKLRAAEAERLATEEQLQALKRENSELKERIHGGKDRKNKEGCGGAKTIEGVVDLTNDDLFEDRVTRLMIENRVLEAEKQKAERDVKAWEDKFKELESWVLHLQKSSVSTGDQWPLAGKSMGRKEEVVDLVVVGSICHSSGKGIGDLKAAGSASDYTPCKRDDCVKEELSSESKAEHTANKDVRRELAFEQERSPGKKMAPPTPAVGRPPSLTIVDLDDSDEEPNDPRVQLPHDNEGSGKLVSPLDCAEEGCVTNEKVKTCETSLKQTNCHDNDVEDISACKEKIPLVSTPKRKRASNIVMSDTDSDSNDNIPIGRLKRMNLRERGRGNNDSYENTTASVIDTGKESATPPRRRLVSLRKCRGKGGSEKKAPSDATQTKCGPGVPTNMDTEDDESDEVGLDSEGESLGGFIVNSSDDSGSDESSGESEDSSDGKIDFSEILSNLHRKKDKKLKWEFEADMLADFGKDIELCMKAVCALYRQQTSAEKISRGTLCYNSRGFSKFDAPRGSTLAEFLTDGDPQGNLKKSAKELAEYDPKAVKLCRTLATNYSKQLFAIYNNKEDPLFLP